jgi:hypothetical protein
MKLEEMVGKMMTEAQFDEAAGEKDACYTKVKARYDVWPSAYASGALVKCRKVGAANWGNSKKEGLDDLKALPKDLKKSINKKRNEGLADKISKNLSKYNKRAQKSKDTMKKYAKAKKKESVDEAAMELNKIKDAILMFQKKIKKGDAVRGSVVIARDEEHLKNLIKVYKKMGGKGIKESVDESKTSNMMRDIRKGGTAGPWDIIISKNNKVVTQVSVKNLKEIPAYLASLRTRYPNHKIGIEAKSGKIVYRESVKEARGTCWVGYQQKGMKDKGGKMVPNCVKEITEIFYEVDGKGYGYTFEHINDGKLNEAEYQGRKVKLGKPMQGDAKKFKVYVKNPKGNTVKVNFGQGGDAKGGTMKIRKSNPGARKSFRARHNCDSPGPRHKARYWSCRKW